MPQSLQPLYVATEAAMGPGGGANVVLLAVGLVEGHPKRSLAFAALNALMAVKRAGSVLQGLSMRGPLPGSRDAVRLERFCREHSGILLQAALEGRNVATIIQSISRGLRSNAVLRQRHGQRLLNEVGALLAAM